MSYWCTAREIKFFIDAANKKTALTALVEYNKIAYPDMESLEGMLYDMFWVCYTDNDGNIYNLDFQGERLGDEDGWMPVIAPYVKAGSYIVMEGEDNYIWRWYFTGEKCIDQPGIITFPPIEQEEWTNDACS